MTVRAAHSLINVIQHRLLIGPTGVTSSVDQIVGVDNSHYVFEFIDPRFFNKRRAIPNNNPRFFSLNDQEYCHMLD